MFIKDNSLKNFLIIALIGAGLLISLIIGVRIYKQKPKVPRVRQYKQLNLYWLPGEFEKQQAVWMQWPSEVYNQGDHPVNPIMVKIIKAFAPYIKVNLMVRTSAEIGTIRNLFYAGGFSGENVYFYLINHLSIWSRDVGPIFLKNGLGKLKVADFVFNNYSRFGDPYYIGTESQVDEQVGDFLGLPVIQSKLISEGGAIEANGRGVLMVTESVALERNPELSKAQIEKEYQRVLGVTKIIWLKKGLAEDDRITGGHINEIARFAAPDTILLGQVLPSDRYTNRFSQESYQRLEENYQILQNSTDQDGKPFRIIRVPMPPTLYGVVAENGNLPVRSYLNFTITNGAVIIQTYWTPGRSELLRTTESEVIGLFGRVFPGRKIIGIDAEDINRWGGGIHCITQDMPG